MTKKPTPTKPESPKNKCGRPTIYTEEMADYICEQMAQGRSLTSICKEDGMPNICMIFSWMNDGKHIRFSENYTRARQAQADFLAEEIIDISNTPCLGEIVTVTPDGRTVVTKDMPEHRKLQIEARKWYAGKINAKKYGDNRKVEMGGNVNVTTEVDVDKVKALANELDSAMNTANDE